MYIQFIPASYRGYIIVLLSFFAVLYWNVSLICSMSSSAVYILDVKGKVNIYFLVKPERINFGLKCVYNIFYQGLSNPECQCDMFMSVVTENHSCNSVFSTEGWGHKLSFCTLVTVSTCDDTSARI
jgi:hypothetical protein